MIQRFEYSIDSFWKFLKMYLEDIQKVSIESASPKAILKICWSLKMFDDVEYDILLKCVSDRNLTSHSYNEDMAERIQEHIPLYYQTMKAVVDKLNVV